MVRLALRPWLEDLVTGDLLLGVHWLKERVAQLEQNIKQEKKAWTTLYRDGESYLDITSHLDRETQHSAQIISVAHSPVVLTLSDGKRAIEAVLAPECVRDLAARYPELDIAHSLHSLHSIVTVHRSALRCTSYGPPCAKLRLVLQQIDWERGNHGQVTGHPDAALAISAVAQRLRELGGIRARQAEKYVYEDLGLDSCDTGDIAEMSQTGRSQAFASQWWSNDEGLQLNSDGNEEEDAERERRPAQDNQRDTDRAKQAQLLALLNLNRGARKQAATGDISRLINPLALQEQQEFANGIPSEPHTTAGAEETVRNTAHMPPPARPLAHNNEQPAASPSASAREASGVEDYSVAQGALSSPQSQPHPSSLEVPPSNGEAHWLQPYVFTDATAKIPQRQTVRLAENSAWHKPPPGTSTVNGNIPIEDFRDIEATYERSLVSPDAEEEVDEHDLQSQSNSLEQTQASCRRTTQTSSDVTSTAGQPTQTETEPEEEDPPSSPIPPWSSSPNAEVPRWRAHAESNLPPDSSVENPQHLPNSSPPAPPASSPAEQQAPAEETTRSSLNHNSQEFDITPSQPATEHNEDDDDMEVDIPLALGEDEHHYHATQSPKLTLTSKYTRQVSIVQVEETPVSKSKPGKYVKSTQTLNSSSGTSNNTSIVHATCLDVSSSAGKPALRDRSSNVPGEGSGDITVYAGMQESGRTESRNGSKAPTAQPPAELIKSAISKKKLPEATVGLMSPPKVARFGRNKSDTSFSITKPTSPLKRKASGSPLSSPHKAKSTKFALGSEFRPKRGSFNFDEQPSEAWTAYLRGKGKLEHNLEEDDRQSPEHREVRVQDADSPERPVTRERSNEDHDNHKESIANHTDTKAQSEFEGAPFTADKETGKEQRNGRRTRPVTGGINQPSDSPMATTKDLQVGTRSNHVQSNDAPTDVPIEVGQVSVTGNPSSSIDSLGLRRCGQNESRDGVTGGEVHRSDPRELDGVDSSHTSRDVQASTAIRNKTDTPDHQQSRSWITGVPDTGILEGKVSFASAVSEAGDSTKNHATETSTMAPVPDSRPDENVPRIVKPQPRPETNQQNHVPTPGVAPETVYQLFKQTYRDYTGNEKHFGSMCKQVHKHQRSLHRMMWDDFVIKSRTVYRDYTAECLEDGREAVPYLQYYEDEVLDIDYKKGVLKNAGTLLLALRELGLDSAPVTALPEPQADVAVTPDNNKYPIEVREARLSPPSSRAANRNALAENGDEPRQLSPDREGAKTVTTVSRQPVGTPAQGYKPSPSILPPKRPAVEPSPTAPKQARDAPRHSDTGLSRIQSSEESRPKKRKNGTSAPSPVAMAASRSRKSLPWQDTAAADTHPRRTSSSARISPPPPKRPKPIDTNTVKPTNRASLSNLPDPTPATASSRKQKEPHRRHTIAPSTSTSASAHEGKPDAALDPTDRNSFRKYAQAMMRTKSVTGSGKVKLDTS